MVMPIVFLFAVLSVSFIGGYRYLAQRRGWVDTPNTRSSHTEITPRGAGIVIVVLCAAAVLLSKPPHSNPALWLSLAPGLIIAAIGWWDDLRGLAATPRFGLYWLCALLALYLWSCNTTLTVATTTWVMLFAGSVGLLWLINLYNFMDGINGVAAFEAVFVMAGSLLIAPASPFAAQLGPMLYCFIAVLAGFLIWNFPIARVFMGDVGSAFLGFLLGLLALWSHSLNGPGIAVWMILLGLFISDSSYTLIVRVVTGQRWHQAHRTHAYQKLAQRLNSHAKTVIVAMGVNIAWLLPMGWMLHSKLLQWPLALTLAYLPLMVTCYALKAGIPEDSGV
jgi:glycosyltransferase WbpL